MKVSLGSRMALVVLAALGGTAPAETPPARGLEAAVRGARGEEGPVWVVWSVPQTGGHSLCCGQGWSRNDRSAQERSVCRLGDDRGYGSSDDERATPSPKVMHVFLRAEGGRLEPLRLFSEGCALETAGATLREVPGVTVGESLRVLAALAEGREPGSDRLADEALMAIAHHDDPAADAALEAFAAPARPEETRKKAAFWMGVARGRRGYETLARFVRDDASDRFREHAVFALSVSHEPAAVDTLLEVARHDPSGRVRGQALFWLGQKAGQKATAGITRAIADDPETDVKKKAVFALSQLPSEQGVPLLVETARTNKNPVVRREAMFWLGQSRDPRALAFIEEVLTR